MKKSLFVCLLLAYSIAVSAQYEAAARFRSVSIPFTQAADTLIGRAMAANPYDTLEGGDVNALKKWKSFMERRVCNDVATDSDLAKPLSVAARYYLSHIGDYCGSGFSGSWASLGPAGSQYGTGSISHGRINSLWVDPADSNIILAGSDAGGLWKSTDDGHNWVNITDASLTGGSNVIGICGVSWIAVNPLDHNNIYIALEISSQNGKSGSYHLGLAFTTDGGSHWFADNDFAIVADDPIPEVRKIAFMPGTQKLFAISNSKVLYKADTVTGWADISPPGIAGISSCTDIEFSVATPGKALFSSTAAGDSSILWVTNASSVGTWAHLKFVLPSPYHFNYYGAGSFSVTSQDTAYIAFDADNAGTRQILLMKTPISTANLTMLNNNFFPHNMQWQVSPGNPNVIYAANYSEFGEGVFQQSTNHGASFSEIGAWHADGRSLYIFSSDANPDNDMVYFGNDGGIEKKRKGHTSTESITGAGLANNLFFGVGNSEADDRYIVSGAHDNGCFSYIRQRTEQWALDANGIDGANCKMRHDDFQDAMGQTNHPGLVSFAISGTSSGISGTAPPSFSEPNAEDRPMYFVEKDTVYIGYAHIWKKGISASGWELLYPHGEPKDGPSDTLVGLRDFYVNEENNDTAYIAYYSTNPNPSANGRLFVSKTATDVTAPVVWANISPSITNHNFINSIAVDPDHNNRIWVAFGNINKAYIEADADTMKNRVWYSSNFGTSWTDVSAGLPPLPINKLLFRKGSVAELYAATDVGVFKWNNTDSKWYCFNTGLPPCIAMDMEFNHCAGKLRLATYGRGVWETTIPAPPFVQILSNTTWAEDDFMASSVKVKSGYTLTIANCTRHMPKDGTIEVEPGARLVVDHATITNSCENCMWYGIEAVGNHSLPQTPSNQGWVVIKNSSIIEHAQYAVSNCNLKDPFYSYSTTGGIIQAYGSTFRNNRQAVTFLPYGYYPSPEVSVFHTSTFLWDAGYKGSSMGFPVGCHASLSGTLGLKFIACDFFNRDTAAGISRKGTGIHAVNSGFYVMDYIPLLSWGPGTPSRFRGFTNGIYIEGIPGDPATRISGAYFDSSSIGIKVFAHNNVDITSCNFKVGNGLALHELEGNGPNNFMGCWQNFGVLLKNAQRFLHRHNVFKGRPSSISSWYNFGTAIVNCGYQSKTVFDNSFDSLTVGVASLGNNRNAVGGGSIAGGLSIRCNSFARNTTDIGIFRQFGLTLPDLQGIAASLGYGYDSLAGNTFSNSTVNIFNNGYDLYYNYDTLNSAAERPNITSTANAKYVYKFPFNHRKECPQVFSGNPSSPFPSTATPAVLGYKKLRSIMAK